jgi:hypothetical protein
VLSLLRPKERLGAGGKPRRAFSFRMLMCLDAIDWALSMAALHKIVFDAQFVTPIRFEEDHNRRLHVHGELGISPDGAELARRCFRRAGGEWNEARQDRAHSQLVNALASNSASRGSQKIVRRFDFRMQSSHLNWRGV